MNVYFDCDDAGAALFNVSFDTWLTRKPCTGPESITAEISIRTHGGDVDHKGEGP